MDNQFTSILAGLSADLRDALEQSAGLDAELEHMITAYGLDPPDEQDLAAARRVLADFRRLEVSADRCAEWCVNLFHGWGR